MRWFDIYWLNGYESEQSPRRYSGGQGAWGVAVQGSQRVRYELATQEVELERNEWNYLDQSKN